jgi:hypothetical protein
MAMRIADMYRSYEPPFRRNIPPAARFLQTCREAEAHRAPDARQERFGPLKVQFPVRSEPSMKNTVDAEQD